MVKWVSRANEKLENISKRQEFAGICILSGCLVFGILLLMGTITSGWHLTDDHNFLVWIYQSKVEGKGFWDILREATISDLSNRFRPLYMPARVLSCYMFGMNLMPYYIMKAMETFFACILLYYVGRLLNGDKRSSFLFMAISMVGYQSAAWWKIGTHEMQGVLLLAAAWLSLMLWIRGKGRIWEVISIISAILMMLYKESFLLLGPFIMAFVVYYELFASNIQITMTSVREAVKRRGIYLMIIGAAFLLFTCYFVFVVGIGGYDMAGENSGNIFMDYWNGITWSLEGNMKWYCRFGVLFTAILLTYWEELKKRWVEMLLVLIFLLPQVVTYGRVGFSGHYLFPISIVISLFFVLWTWNWKPLKGKRRVVYILGVLLLMGAHGRVALREADYFRLRGEGITTAFETIKELSEDNDEFKVLSCFDYNTEANMTLQYWLLDNGIDNLYYWSEEDQTISLNYQGTRLPKEDTVQCTIGDMDAVIIHNKDDRHWYYAPSLDLSDFKELPCGTLTLYVRNDAGFDIPEIQVEDLRIWF